MKRAREKRRIIDDLVGAWASEFKPRAYKGGGGGEYQPPIRFFLNFFSETNYHRHLMCSVAMHISLSHISTQDW